MKKSVLRPMYKVTFKKIRSSRIKPGDTVLMMPAGEDDVNMKDACMLIVQRVEKLIDKPKDQYAYVVNENRAWNLPNFKFAKRAK